MIRRRETGIGWKTMVWLILLLTLGVTGCGRTGTVSGTVRYKGQLLPLGLIVFYNAENKQVASAPIQPDGSYEATKVPAGPVTIAVTTPRPISSKQEKQAESMVKKMKGGQVKMSNAEAQELLSKSIPIDLKYADPTQSGITTEVTGGSQTYNIDLK
jgi:hypothetical protein